MPFDQIDKPAILRPLGEIEKLFWLISQNRQAHFAITAEGDHGILWEIGDGLGRDCG